MILGRSEALNDTNAQCRRGLGFLTYRRAQTHNYKHSGAQPYRQLELPWWDDEDKLTKPHEQYDLRLIVDHLSAVTVSGQQ